MAFKIWTSEKTEFDLRCPVFGSPLYCDVLCPLSNLGYNNKDVIGAAWKKNNFISQHEWYLTATQTYFEYCSNMS